MKKGKIAIVILVILFFSIFFFASWKITDLAREYFTTVVQAEPKISDFEYAIIFYPDGKTFKEGYIDRYVYSGGDLIEVSIEGTNYIVSSKNCIIIKNKSLTINKEDTE